MNYSDYVYETSEGYRAVIEKRDGRWFGRIHKDGDIESMAHPTERKKDQKAMIEQQHGELTSINPDTIE